MTAAQEAKDYGFKSLEEVSRFSGFTRRKLYTIYKSNYSGFQTILVGAWMNKGGCCDYNH